MKLPYHFRLFLWAAVAQTFLIASTGRAGEFNPDSLRSLITASVQALPDIKFKWRQKDEMDETRVYEYCHYKGMFYYKMLESSVKKNPPLFMIAFDGTSFYHIINGYLVVGRDLKTSTQYSMFQSFQVANPILQPLVYLCDRREQVFSLPYIANSSVVNKMLSGALIDGVSLDDELKVCGFDLHRSFEDIRVGMISGANVYKVEGYRHGEARWIWEVKKWLSGKPQLKTQWPIPQRIERAWFKPNDNSKPYATYWAEILPESVEMVEKEMHKGDFTIPSSLAEYVEDLDLNASIKGFDGIAR